jgi:hypothetical protein
MDTSQLSSGRSITLADINRNGRPTSIGMGGPDQSEGSADILGIRNRGGGEAVGASHGNRLITY